MAASLAVVVMFAIVVPISAGASDAGMTQTKRYESVSSLSATKLREPVSFRVPQRARSVRVAIVDDTGVQVRAVVQGDVVPRKSSCGRVFTYYMSCTSPPHNVCAGHPRKVLLARGARALTVSPDAGLGSFETPIAGSGDPGDCFSPLSLPTRGTITVVFSRSA